MNKIPLIIAGCLVFACAAFHWVVRPGAESRAVIRARGTEAPGAPVRTELAEDRGAAAPIHPAPPVLNKLPLASVFPEMEGDPAQWLRLKPAELSVSPIEGAPISFSMTEYKEENGRATWTGRNADLPLASLVFSANESAWAGVLLLPGGGEYSLHGLPDGGIAVRKASDTPLHCPVGDAHDAIAGASTEAAENRARNMQDTAAAPPAEPPETEPDFDSPDENGIYYSDLLIVVDKPFVDALGLPPSASQGQRQAQVEATAAVHTASMNTILQNSQVNNLRWRLAGTVIAPDDYVHQNLYQSLREMADFGDVFEDGTPTVPSTKMGEPARRAASRLGADQVLFITGTHVGDNYAGLAYGLGTSGTGTLTRPCFFPYAAAYSYLPVMSLAHELAHNLGARHDRDTSAVPDNDGNYNYGYMWSWTAMADAPTIQLGDVMSYSYIRVPYFSNPQIEIDHAEFALTVFGTDDIRFLEGSTRIGVPVGEPRAADAARWLREHAQQMASFRSPLAFLQQPAANTTGTAGWLLRLSGQATVGRTDLGNWDKITYQWYLNNQPIVRESSAFYARGKSSTLEVWGVTAADSGTYTLVATSLGGVSITSQPAIVTVETPPPVILAHPQSVSVAKGGTLALSASASGFDLAFQWTRNNAPIPGATSLDYTKTNAAGSDAGSYTLTVTNDGGSATTYPATVTVVDTGDNGGGNNNGGGGGGGGGAPGAWFFFACAVIAALRLCKKFRKGNPEGWESGR
jgi:hypothetical protein